jgi:hypothetical protein
MTTQTPIPRPGAAWGGVRVEHVTAQAGGRAIVGNLTRGTGGKAKSEEQPDAKHLTHAPGETLPSDIKTNPKAVQLASG